MRFGRAKVAWVATVVAAVAVGCDGGSPSGANSPGATNGAGGGTGGGTGGGGTGGGSSGGLQVANAAQFPSQQGGDGGLFMHTATLLDDGRVLIVGGLVPDPAGPSGQGPGINIGFYIFDHTAGVLTDSLANVASAQQLQDACMTAPGQMDIGGQVVPFVVVGRFGHTATALPNGKVLIAGGYGWDRTDATNQPIQEILSSAHLYDPATNKFEMVTSRMRKPRAFHQAVRLQSGKVLLAGGVEDDALFGGSGTATSVKEVEVYDPSTNTFSPAGSMENGLLWAAHGPVGAGAIIWGGLEWALDTQSGQNSLLLPLNAQQSAFNVGFAFDGNSTTSVVHSTQTGDGYNMMPAFATASGRLVMAGGYVVDQAQGALVPGTMILVVDALTGGYSQMGDLNAARLGGAAAELGSGDVLICGGNDDSGGGQSAPNFPALAELWNFQRRGIVATTNMIEPRMAHTCVRLKNGHVAVIGGTTGGTDSLLGFDGYPCPTIEVFSK